MGECCICPIDNLEWGRYQCTVCVDLSIPTSDYCEQHKDQHDLMHNHIGNLIDKQKFIVENNI